MFHWQDFKTQAEDDIKTADVCFENKSYGTSAYHYQQALEKIIKAVLLRNQTPKDPSKFGHMPLIQLFEDMEKQLDFKRIFPTEHVKFIQSVNEILKRILTDIQKKGTVKTIWWKYSLSIPLSKCENEQLILYRDDIEKLCVQAQAFEKYVVTKLQKDIGGSITRKTKKRLPDELVSHLDRLQDITKELQMNNSINFKKIMSICEIYFDTLKITHKHMPGFRTTPKFYQQDIRPLLTMWLFRFMDPMLKIFSHVNLGRYPEEIDGNKTNEWYKIKNEQLKVLELDVKKSCEKIIQTALT